MAVRQLSVGKDSIACLGAIRRIVDNWMAVAEHYVDVYRQQSEREQCSRIEWSVIGGSERDNCWSTSGIGAVESSLCHRCEWIRCNRVEISQLVDSEDGRWRVASSRVYSNGQSSSQQLDVGPDDEFLRTKDCIRVQWPRDGIQERDNRGLWCWCIAIFDHSTGVRQRGVCDGMAIIELAAVEGDGQCVVAPCGDCDHSIESR